MAAAVFSKEREAREKAEARALEAQRLAELEARIAQVPDSDIEHDAGIIEIEGQICAVDVLIDEVGGGREQIARRQAVPDRIAEIGRAIAKAEVDCSAAELEAVIDGDLTMAKAMKLRAEIAQLRAWQGSLQRGWTAFVESIKTDISDERLAELIERRAEAVARLGRTKRRLKESIVRGTYHARPSFFEPGEPAVNRMPGHNESARRRAARRSQPVVESIKS